MTSDLFKLNWKDVVKGLLLAVSGAVIVSLHGALQNNSPIDWNLVLKVAEGAFFSYVLKNFFTDSEGKLLGKI